MIVQIGNAVAPPMARKLGLCIIAALTRPFTGHGTREDEHVIAVRDAEMDEVHDACVCKRGAVMCGEAH